MEEEKESQDPTLFKGFLPTYMKQGIPPFLQILFAARAPLPYLPPVKKPPRMQVKGFFDGLDYNAIGKSIEEKKSKDEKMEEFFLNKEVDIQNPHTNRIAKWKHQMLNHVKRKKEEYTRWLKEEKYSNENKTKNPRNTVIVSSLVSLSAQRCHRRLTSKGNVSLRRNSKYATDSRQRRKKS